MQMAGTLATLSSPSVSALGTVKSTSSSKTLGKQAGGVDGYIKLTAKDNKNNMIPVKIEIERLSQN